MDWDDIQREFDRVNEMSCKPVGLQKYKVGHIFDENRSVKWNREKLEEENKKYNDEVARLNTEKNGEENTDGIVWKRYSCKDCYNQFCARRVMAGEETWPK